MMTAEKKVRAVFPRATVESLWADDTGTRRMYHVREERGGTILAFGDTKEEAWKQAAFFLPSPATQDGEG